MADATPSLAVSRPSIRTITGWTIFFMVVLRIMIGWHFFYEGIWKLMQDDWRATGYLTASAGPFRPLFQAMVKDVDGLERLTRESMYERMDQRRDLAIAHYNLDDNQRAFFTSFVERKKHGIRDDNNISAIFDNSEFQRQLADYRTKIARGEPADRDAILGWFKPVFDDLDEAVKSVCTAEQKKAGQPPPMPSLVPEGIKSPDDLYWFTEAAKEDARKNKRDKTGEDISQSEARELGKAYLYSQLNARYDTLRKHYGLDGTQNNSSYGWRYREQKKIGGARDPNNVDAIWSDTDFQAQLVEYKGFLKDIEALENDINIDYNTERVTYDYGKKARARGALLSRFEIPLSDVDPARIETFGEKMGLDAGFPDGFKLTPEQLQAGPIPGEKSRTRLIDWANMLALTAVGVCLMVGLFTRLAALGGVGLLALYYFAMPPFPGLFESPMAEGHYLIVDKNLIEAVALLMIATSRVGRWAGLDAYLWAGARPKTAPSAPPVVDAEARRRVQDRIEDRTVGSDHQQSEQHREDEESEG